MIKMRKPAALVLALALALALLPAASPAEGWHVPKKAVPGFQDLLNRLKWTLQERRATDRTTADAMAEAVGKRDADSGDVARAVVEHWFSNVLDDSYPMYVHRGEDTAAELEESGLKFGGQHAFVVLGFRLENGEMAPELVGRCRAAAAAARSYPSAVLICTGGVTGSGNPDRHSEAGQMKKFLTEKCGIRPERILTDEEAMTTADNAVNSLRLIKKYGIRKYTLITSDYHQLWSQILFNAAAAMAEKETGYPIRLVGNYNYPAQPDTPRRAHCATAANQLRALMRNEAGMNP